MTPYAAEFPSATTLRREVKRATKLLKDLRAGDAGAAARFRYHHPRFAWMTDEAVRGAARMPDARFVAAREYGFSSWARLREYLEALGGKRDLRHPFETDLQYYRGRAAGMLSVFSTGGRNALRLVRLFHPDYSEVSEADIRNARLTQADAELILAREHGFETFDALPAISMRCVNGACRSRSRSPSQRSRSTTARASMNCLRITRVSSTRPAPTATGC